MDYWEENGIEKPKQVVVCAAILIDTLIICGARHCDKVMRHQAEAAGLSMKFGEQGFIDQFGTFLSRKEAMDIVNENKQHLHGEHKGGDILYGECLY